MLCRSIFTYARLNPNTHCSYHGLRSFSRNPKKPGREKTNLRPKEIKKFKLLRLCNPDRGGSKNFELIKVTQLWKPFTFSVSVIGLSFGSAAIIEYERMGARLRKQKDKFKEWWRKYPQIREYFNTWQKLTPSEKVFWGMCSFNFLVLLGLRLMPQRLFYYFSSQPFQKPLYAPMVLSIFGHSSFLHLFLNMYALHSCLPAMRFFLGDEQLWALYLSAGVFASFVSLANKAVKKTSIPSLGASGAILGVVAAFCIIQPDARLGLAFFGDITFPAKYGLASLLFIDSLGVLRGWRLIDHAAHLGGTFFGIWYVKFGQDTLWRYRRKLAKKWHELKRKI